MQRQVMLVLVALCVLLGCACSEQKECEFVERVNSSLGMAMASPLMPARNLDLDACITWCCALPTCDTFMLEKNQLCHVYRCDGQCQLQDVDDDGQHRVFTRSDPPSNPPLHIAPMMLGTGTGTRTRTENQKNSSDVCALPRVVGMCKAAFRRFYFNTASNACEAFTYGGCGANDNNFETLSECQQRCPGGSKGPNDAAEAKASDRKSARMAAPLQAEMTEDDFKELCLAPPVVGLCRAAFQRWFYNATSGRCSRFVYGGCKGNKNNHESEEHCTSACAGVKVLPSKKKQAAVLSADYEAHCTVAPDSGPCRAALSMFYFDPKTQTCKTFLYGGCRGNDNRYGSEDECVERCANAGESTEGRGHERKRWTAAFFLLLTLAAASFLLLTALIFITMRRNRTPRRALSIRSDKEELLPDSERSSVDSLPLPESPNKA